MPLLGKNKTAASSKPQPGSKTAPSPVRGRPAIQEGDLQDLISLKGTQHTFAFKCARMSLQSPKFRRLCGSASVAKRSFRTLPKTGPLSPSFARLPRRLLYSVTISMRRIDSLLEGG